MATITDTAAGQALYDKNFSGANTIVEDPNVVATTVTAGQFKLSALNTAPASAAATGTLGEIRITADSIYVCIATDTWVKAAIATWI